MLDCDSGTVVFVKALVHSAPGMEITVQYEWASTMTHQRKFANVVRLVPPVLLFMTGNVFRTLLKTVKYTVPRVCDMSYHYTGTNGQS